MNAAWWIENGLLWLWALIGVVALAAMFALTRKPKPRRNYRVNTVHGFARPLHEPPPPVGTGYTARADLWPAGSILWVCAETGGREVYVKITDRLPGPAIKGTLLLDCRAFERLQPAGLECLAVEIVPLRLGPGIGPRAKELSV